MAFKLQVDVEGNIGNLPAVMAQASAVVQSFGSTVDAKMAQAKASFSGLRSELGSTLFSPAWAAANEQHLNTVGRAAVGFGAVVVGGLGFAAKAAIDWESAWAGVTKTTDATAAQLPALEKGLRDMTSVLPASHAEIAAVAEAAGQLGVKSGDVLAFTRVMIDLGESTNVTSDAAATAIAQISNVFGEGFPISEVENFGSALVALGNDGASTEAQILDIAQRMSGMANVAGMSVQDTLGFANAVASVGVNAEVGGSSMSRLMASMSKAVSTNSADLQKYAEVSDVTAGQFAEAWRTRPAEAIAMFTQGLGRMIEEGGNTAGVLSELKLSQVGLSQTLLSLAGAGDLLTDSLSLSNEAWDQNTALAEEAGKRYETSASRIAIARNQLTEVGISLGSTLLPAIASAADGIADLAGWFADLPDPIQRTVAVLGALVGVTALVGGGALLAIPKIAALRTSLEVLERQTPRTTSALGRLGRTFSVVGALVAIGQIAGAMVNMNAAAEEGQGSLAGMQNLANSGEWQKLSGTFASIGTSASGNAVPAIKDFAGAMDLLVGGGFDAKMERFGQGLSNIFTGGSVKGVVSDAQTSFEGLSASLAGLVESGDTDKAAAGFKHFAAEAEAAGYSQEQLLGLLPAYRDALYEVATQQGLTLTETQLLALANGDLATAGVSVEQSATMQTAALEKTAASLGMTAEQYKEAQEAGNKMVEALATSIGGFVDANGTFTGMLEEGETAWESYKDGVSVSIDELNAKLREQVEAQTNWSSNLLALSGTLSSETLAYLQSLGVEGAPMVQQLFKEMTDGNTAALEEFDANVQRAVGIAPAAYAAMLLEAGPLVAHVGATQGQEAATALSASLVAGLEDGSLSVRQAAENLGLELQQLEDGTWTVVPITADTTPAEDEIATLPGVADGTEAEVTVDAATADAAAAVLDFKGDASTPVVTPIEADYTDGRSGHAQFLEYVHANKPVLECDADTGQATLSVDAFKGYVAALDPEATVGASTDPATGKVEAFVTWADGSRSEVSVDANDGTARTTVTGFLDDTNQRTGTVTIAAGDRPARGTLGAVLWDVNTSTGTMTVAGNDSRARGTLGAVLWATNTSTGTIGVGANDGSARRTISGVADKDWRATITASAATATAEKDLSWAARTRNAIVNLITQGGAAEGGAIQFRAGGGAVYGPGTGTSDSVQAVGPQGQPFRLSNNEHVLTSREVDLMGGQGAVYAWRSQLLNSRGVPGFADGGALANMPTYPGAPPVYVNPTVTISNPNPVQVGDVTYQITVDVHDLAGMRHAAEFFDMMETHAAMAGITRPGR